MVLLAVHLQILDEEVQCVSQFAFFCALDWLQTRWNFVYLSNCPGEHLARTLTGTIIAAKVFTCHSDKTPR